MFLLISTAMDIPILRELIIILAASIAVFLISHRLKIPTVVGFLVTGILIGPWGLRLIRDAQSIDALAEIGVVMLLFTIGIEFSLKKLKQIKKIFWIGGSLQVLMTIFLVAGILSVFHVPWNTSVFYGFLIACSSTAVVMKLYSDRSELDSPQGRLSLGISLFQDISLVPMIVMTPILGASLSISLKVVLLRFLLSGLVIGAVVFLAQRLMPKILYVIVKSRVREIFLITTLFLCLGMSLLTFSFGLSFALGAFIAGIIISESEYSHQVASEIMPFKDLFSSIFFISVGMLLNVQVAWDGMVFIIILSLSILFLKCAVVFFTVRILKYPARIAFITGLGLVQIGELSFVLANLGKANGFLSEEIFQAFIASSILTILATPFFIHFSPYLADRTLKLFRWKARLDESTVEKFRALKNHVVIAGYGLNGQNLARVLKETGIPFVVIELNPDTVKNALKRGEPIIFGDTSTREILETSGIERARVIVFAISDPGSIKRGVKMARQMNRDAHIIVRTRYVSEIDELYKLGADQVIPEEFETSIEIFARVLEEFHVPRNIIDTQVKVIRSEGYSMLRSAPKTRRRWMEKIADLLRAGTAETFFVFRDSPAAGQSLRGLDLRQKTGATVIAVVRSDQSFASPSPDFRIEEGDILVLVASHQDMEKAFHFLGSRDLSNV